ncbi:GNAT family N-acetyltransferase [Paenibacillus sp. EC2-1]|uniref:GNAT family N-acetyltransferase n=1 Tax=Paenibacillus sp. EC2-1 TaxID=3388665 RepID=UPI003BEED16A
MNRHMAEIICSWEYPAPYDFYSFDSSEEAMEELLNGEYFVVLNRENQLTGYFCYGQSARVAGGYPAGIYLNEERLDIGLGMNPAFTGQGQGRIFVAEGLQFMKERYLHDRFRLVVACFNTRAKKVYIENGFMERSRFYSEVKGKKVEFLWMETV